MDKVKALALLTRQELEKAMADVNVTRRLQHQLIAIQQAQIAELERQLAALTSKNNETKGEANGTGI